MRPCTRNCSGGPHFSLLSNFVEVTKSWYDDAAPAVASRHVGLKGENSAAHRCWGSLLRYESNSAVAVMATRRGIKSSTIEPKYHGATCTYVVVFHLTWSSFRISIFRSPNREYIFAASLRFLSRCADVILEVQEGAKWKDLRLGSFGMLHPEVLQAFELRDPSSALEMDLEPLM